MIEIIVGAGIAIALYLLLRAAMWRYRTVLGRIFDAIAAPCRWLGRPIARLIWRD